MILYIALRDAVEALGRRDSVSRFSTAEGYSIAFDAGRGFRVTREGCPDVRGVPLSNVTSWHEVPDVVAEGVVERELSTGHVSVLRTPDPERAFGIRIDPNVKRRR